MALHATEPLFGSGCSNKAECVVRTVPAARAPLGRGHLILCAGAAAEPPLLTDLLGFDRHCLCLCHPGGKEMLCLQWLRESEIVENKAKKNPLLESTSIY